MVLSFWLFEKEKSRSQERVKKERTFAPSSVLPKKRRFESSLFGGGRNKERKENLDNPFKIYYIEVEEVDKMFLDPTNDVAFKRIFGNENKKNILISFLNSILELPNDRLITEINIENPYQIPKIKELKETILDVRCKDSRGINYIVEIQLCKQSAFEKRVLYYTSKAYTNQIEIGEDYPKLNQIIFLGILDFMMFDGNNYLSTHLILNKETLKNEFKDFRFSFVELPKFNKNERELATIEDKWIYFLKNAKNIKIIPENIQESDIKDAFELLDKYGWSKEELEIYDTISIYRQDERGRLEQAKVEGEKIGIEKGKTEGKYETAKKMKQKGFDIKVIAEITGLTENEIEKL